MPIVTDDGFRPDDGLEPLPLDALADRDGPVAALLLPNDADPSALVPAFERIGTIVIPFPSFADGRGFSLARRLRDLGYGGRLRAEGHLIADQYGFARDCGFDEARIDDALAARQPEPQWRRGRALSYRDKLARRAA